MSFCPKPFLVVWNLFDWIIIYLVCAELFNLDPHLTNTLDKTVVNRITATPEVDLNTLEPVQLSRIGILVATELSTDPTGI